MLYKKLKHIFTLQVTITMRRNFMLHSLLNASNPNCVWICVYSLFKVLKDWGIIMYTSFFSLYESSVFQKACITNKSCFLPKWKSLDWISNLYAIYINQCCKNCILRKCFWYSFLNSWMMNFKKIQAFKTCLSNQYIILPHYVIYGF